MPATTSHPVFTAPSDPDIRIWRYLDLAKYIALFEAGALFFPRVDLLGDPFEGARSRANFTKRQEVYGDRDLPPDVVAQLGSAGKWEREWTFVSCWHMNRYESAAMWRLYAKSNDAVALQSTYKRLCSVLPTSAFVGVVHYVDYEEDWIPEGNGFAKFVCKRKSFEHEQELRAVISELPVANGVTQVGLRNPEAGREVQVNLPELVESVYVAPTAATWLRMLVEQVTRRYGFEWPVRQSALDESPLF